MSNSFSEYFLRNTDGNGTVYLVERTGENLSSGKYRWDKVAKSKAAKMSYDACQKARIRYGGGTMVKVTTTIEVKEVEVG